MFLDLWQLFIAPENRIFSIFITVCLFLLVLEMITLVFGLSSSALDGLVPDMDVDVAHGNFLVTPSAWLSLGKVPFLLWLVIFFGGWGVVGLVMQATLDDIFGAYLLPVLAVPVAFVINLFVVHFICKLVNPIFSDKDNKVVSEDDFIGLEAEIVIGVAEKNKAAQARLIDSKGNAHYIMVEPLADDTRYVEGDKIIVFERGDDAFLVMQSQDLYLQYKNSKSDINS